jgi:hypothetical protein
MSQETESIVHQGQEKNQLIFGKFEKFDGEKSSRYASSALLGDGGGTLSE